MSRFRTQFEGVEYTDGYEINNDPSLTIPDQTMPMREIVQRYAAGMPIESGREGVYHDEETNGYLPDFSMMSKIEIEEFKHENYERFVELKKIYDEELTEEEKAKQEKLAQEQNTINTKLKHYEELLATQSGKGTDL